MLHFIQDSFFSKMLVNQPFCFDWIILDAGCRISFKRHVEVRCSRVCHAMLNVVCNAIRVLFKYKPYVFNKMQEQNSYMKQIIDSGYMAKFGSLHVLAHNAVTKVTNLCKHLVSCSLEHSGDSGTVPPYAACQCIQFL